MFEQLDSVDLGIFIAYIVGMIGFAIYISFSEKTENAQDYFLASRALPWWAVGGSLIASNISTEQILAMNGSGFELGLAIATYEMMAAITLILVAKFLLPIFLKEGIYTMPQFLERRFDQRSRTLMSIFWIALFVLVNISSVLYLGGLAIESVLGVPMIYGIVALVLYSASFSIFGGLKAVVWTDIVQVVVLVVGGLAATYFVLEAVDGSFFGGIAALYEAAPERFEMIFERDDIYYSTTDSLVAVVEGVDTVQVPFIDQDYLAVTGVERAVRVSTVESAYDLLPGIGVLFGGMWITNLYYWGTNQYIIQRALAAKSLQEAQRGVAFASIVKIILPIIVVIPGIAAYVLGAELYKADEAFPWVLANYVPAGIKGLVFAGLVAAVGSSISSMVNSSSTIFTIDIYKDVINKTAGERQLVNVGRISGAVALVVGALIAPALDGFQQVFQFIQEFTGFVSPAVLAVFIFGMFWKRTTADAAFYTIWLSVLLSPGIAWLLPDLPFLDRMAIVFLLCCASLAIISGLATPSRGIVDKRPVFRYVLAGLLTMVSVATGLKMAISGVGVERGVGIATTIAAAIMIYILLTERGEPSDKAIDVEPGLFKTAGVFNTIAFGLVVFLSAFYFLLR